MVPGGNDGPFYFFFFFGEQLLCHRLTLVNNFYPEHISLVSFTLVCMMCVNFVRFTGFTVHPRLYFRLITEDIATSGPETQTVGGTNRTSSRIGKGR